MSKISKSKNLIRGFSRYFLPYIYHEAALIFLLILASVGSLATPYALKIIIDNILPHGNLRSLIYLLSALVGIYIIRIIANILGDIIQTHVSQKIVADIRRDMLSNLLNQPLDFYQKKNTGEILYTIMSDVQNIQNSLSALILLFLNDIVTVIGILVMLCILNLKLTLISLTLIPVIIFSLKKFTPKLQAGFKFVQHSEENLNNFFLEKLKNIRVIKSFNTLKYEIDRLQYLQGDLVGAYVKNTKISTFNSNIITFLVAIGPIIVLIYGGNDVFKGSMTVGALIAFIQYLNRLYSPTMNIMNSYTQLNRAIVSMERVSPYLEIKQMDKNYTQTLPFEENIYKLTLENISLSFGQTPVLNKVNMEFCAGKIYGIIGPSGSGKSSLINMICGFIIPNSGKILINDNRPIQEITEWNSHLGLIEKENQLFNGSILENIKYGSFLADDTEVEFAIANARFREVLNNLDNGSKTIINDNGNILSDGQKQRISIARTLLKKPSIILFDESTASLDIQLERQIIMSLKKHYAESIIIIITHRQSSLSQFDHIYNMEEIH